jgi:hypothetical protein
VFRAISSSVLSFLMTLTLVWGGCISCRQFFMFPKVEKSCCNKSGQCERPNKKDPVKECTKMPIDAQGFAAAHADLAIELVTADPIFIQPALVASVYPHDAIMPAVEHPPPELNILLSSFVI